MTGSAGWAGQAARPSNRYSERTQVLLLRPKRSLRPPSQQSGTAETHEPSHAAPLSHPLRLARRVDSRLDALEKSFVVRRGVPQKGEETRTDTEERRNEMRGEYAR